VMDLMISRRTNLPTPLTIKHDLVVPLRVPDDEGGDDFVIRYDQDTYELCFNRAISSVTLDDIAALAAYFNRCARAHGHPTLSGTAFDPRDTFPAIEKD
jgi:hypothetical protein